MANPNPVITHQPITIGTRPDPCPDTSYLEQEGFEDRLRQAENGLFGFIGVLASCEFTITLAGQPSIVHTFESPGVWGVETDSDPAYIQQLYQNEHELLTACSRPSAVKAPHTQPAPPSRSSIAL